MHPDSALSAAGFLALLGQVTGFTNPPPPSPSDVHLSNEWEGTRYFAFWELGQSDPDDNEHYGGCFPQEDPSNPPTNYPCTGLQEFFANCSYGISLAEAFKSESDWTFGPFINGSPFRPRTNASQQACYCSGDYWEYVRDCNACMMDHDYTAQAISADMQTAWMPSQWIDEQSSSYCSGDATAQALDFFYSFVPADILAAQTVTPTSTIPTSVTAVSAYATLTATVTAPTQASQIGTLVPTAATTTTSSGAGEIHATYEPALVAWITVFFGFVGLLA